MPITLVTGLPGHGKTLYTLARWKGEAEKAGRPVFHNDISGLSIPNWQAWDVKDWEKLPAGALMIVDEAQFAFPVTGRGQTPDWVQKLATHRHLGLDFVVITQNPMLLDSFVRRLVDRHFHVVRKFGTHFATIYEFPNGVRENVATKRDDGIRHEWKYPKEVFDWYKSAELHTVKRRIPMRVWLLLLVPFAFMTAAGYAWWRLKPENAAARISQESADTKTTQQSQQNRHKGQDKDNTKTPLEYAESFTPRIEGLPHTAPIYDEVTKPTTAPYPAACIASKSKCRCYSQQATQLQMPEQLCRDIAAGGFFVAWGQPLAQAVALQPAASAPQGANNAAQVYGFDSRRPYPQIGTVAQAEESGEAQKARVRR